MGREAEQVEGGQKIRGEAVRRGGGGKEGRQTVSELEGSEAERVGGAGGGVGYCHIHPYHSGRQFSKCLFFYEAPQHSLHIKPNGAPSPQLPPRQTHPATSL